MTGRALPTMQWDRQLQALRAHQEAQVCHLCTEEDLNYDGNYSGAYGTAGRLPEELTDTVVGGGSVDFPRV